MLFGKVRRRFKCELAIFFMIRRGALMLNKFQKLHKLQEKTNEINKQNIIMLNTDTPNILKNTIRKLFNVNHLVIVDCKK